MLYQTAKIKLFLYCYGN